MFNTKASRILNVDNKLTPPPPPKKNSKGTLGADQNCLCAWSTCHLPAATGEPGLSGSCSLCPLRGSLILWQTLPSTAQAFGTPCGSTHALGEDPALDTPPPCARGPVAHPGSSTPRSQVPSPWAPAWESNRLTQPCSLRGLRSSLESPFLLWILKASGGRITLPFLFFRCRVPSQ